MKILKKNNFTDGNLAFIFFADYIEIYGLDDFKTSAKAFVSITQFISCEFAVRPFILKYKEKMIDEMVKWSLHENHHVRRLVKRRKPTKITLGNGDSVFKKRSNFNPAHFRKPKK